MRPLALALLAVAALCWGQAGWIHGKAALAQILLERAWARSRAGGDPVRPWPWADTHPVARLEVPRLRVSRIVLAGDSGAALAFGPGHAIGSALPGSPGTAIVSGHRDTHFRFLAELRVGDDLLVHRPAAGGPATFRVEQIRVVDTRTHRLWAGGASMSELVLVTCWPFDALSPGGPLRYVVLAGESGAERATMSRSTRTTPLSF